MWRKGNIYCYFVKRKQIIKKIKGVALVNKAATQRSWCTVCTSRESTFLKKPKIHRWQKNKCFLCYNCHNNTKDINSGTILTKNRLTLNKTKCFGCGFKMSKRLSQNVKT